MWCPLRGTRLRRDAFLRDRDQKLSTVGLLTQILGLKAENITVKSFCWFIKSDWCKRLLDYAWRHQTQRLTVKYCSLVLPILNYCVEICWNNYNSNMNPIYLLQKKAIRIVRRADNYWPNTLKWPCWAQCCSCDVWLSPGDVWVQRESVEPEELRQELTKRDKSLEQFG